VPIGELNVDKIADILLPVEADPARKMNQTFDLLMKDQIVQCEQLFGRILNACSTVAATPPQTCVVIIDAQGFDIKQAYDNLNYIKPLASMLGKFYPDCLGRMFIINAPPGGSALFSAAMTPFLNLVTTSKITIESTEYRRVLLERIDEDKLPKYYGGSCNCVAGCNKSNVGPWQS
jgi:hypothetical protein